jgi:hypothetical protein
MKAYVGIAVRRESDTIDGDEKGWACVFWHVRKGKWIVTENGFHRLAIKGITGCSFCPHHHHEDRRFI